MPQTGPSWSDKETATLRREYRRVGADGLLRRLRRRTRTAIERRASALGLTDPHDRRLWTPAELRILERDYPSRGTAIADRLGRSAKAVKCQAARRGIRYAGA